MLRGHLSPAPETRGSSIVGGQDGHTNWGAILDLLLVGISFLPKAGNRVTGGLALQATPAAGRQVSGPPVVLLSADA